MSEGVFVELKELVGLRRYAQRVGSSPAQKVQQRAGQHHSKLRGRGMDFAEVRNYQSGDELRHMEWRVTARTGRPHIKLYQEEVESPVIILVDFNPSMFFGTHIAFKSVVAAKLAALLVWTAVKRGDRTGGLIFSSNQHSEFTPKSQEKGVLPFLAALSAYSSIKPSSLSKKFDHPKPLSEALLRLRRVTRPGSIVVLISDFYNMDVESEQHLSRLSYQNDVLAYHVCDRLELAAPPPQQYAITDGQKTLVLDTTQLSIAQAYQNYFDQQQLKLTTQFKKAQIQYVQVTAALDLPTLLRSTFPRRQRG